MRRNDLAKMLNKKYILGLIWSDCVGLGLSRIKLELDKYHIIRISVGTKSNMKNEENEGRGEMEERKRSEGGVKWDVEEVKFWV